MTGRAPTVAAQPTRSAPELAGRIAVITGAAGGIGQALVEAALTRGMRVYAVDKDVPGLAALADRLATDRLASCPCDLREPSQIAAIARQVLNESGTIHLLFNNAGEVTTGPVWRHGPDDLADLFAVNVLAIANLVHAVLPAMMARGDWGVIVNTASAGGLVTAPGLGAYQATKHAVVGYTESLYRDLAMAGSRISAALVCPGAVATDIITRSHASRAQWLDGPAPPEGPAMAPREAMAPQALAEIVFDAVVHGKFWILPDDRTAQDIAKRFSLLAQGQVYMGSKGGRQ